ncbi:hypothetical protein [Streptacidiphilus monticola]|uniref:Shikimate kinase n=1 Tax=Streptacidiphilus monticola TaxID=2161674 RepID=A0ABW1G3K5_9ACTN
MTPPYARALGDLDRLRDRLRHVRWLGGGSGAGKSTVARHLAARYGLHLYGTDAAMPDHARRARPEATPLLQEFTAMDMDARWLDRSPETMLATFHWFAGEGFDLIVEDLLQLPTTTPVLAEGFRLLPGLVAPLLTDPAHQAVWLLPTPDFRRAAFAHRGSLWSIAGRTSDPERALTHLLTRDALFTDRLRGETASAGLPSVTVTPATTEPALTAHVAEVFSLCRGRGRS